MSNFPFFLRTKLCLARKLRVGTCLKRPPRPGGPSRECGDSAGIVPGVRGRCAHGCRLCSTYMVGLKVGTWPKDKDRTSARRPGCLARNLRVGTCLKRATASRRHVPRFGLLLYVCHVCMYMHMHVLCAVYIYTHIVFVLTGLRVKKISAMPPGTMKVILFGYGQPKASTRKYRN